LNGKTEINVKKVMAEFEKDSDGEFPLRLYFFMQHHLLSLTLAVHLQHQ
jgi:hypothetical protein